MCVSIGEENREIVFAAVGMYGGLGSVMGERFLPETDLASRVVKRANAQATLVNVRRGEDDDLRAAEISRKDKHERAQQCSTLIRVTICVAVVAYLAQFRRANTDKDLVVVARVHVVADATLVAWRFVATTVVAPHCQGRSGPLRTRLGKVTNLVPRLGVAVEQFCFPVAAAALLHQGGELQGQHLPEHNPNDRKVLENVSVEKSARRPSM